jgi:hypothetical protein
VKTVWSSSPSVQNHTTTMSELAHGESFLEEGIVIFCDYMEWSGGCLYINGHGRSF